MVAIRKQFSSWLEAAVLVIAITIVVGNPLPLGGTQKRTQVDIDNDVVKLIRQLGGTATKKDFLGRYSPGWIIDLSDAKIKKQHWKQIAKLYQVSDLRCCDMEIPTEGLKWIGTRKRLGHLWLAGSKFDPRGLKYLSKLSPIQLDLSETVVDDDGLRRLRKLSPIVLSLGKTKISDAGLKQIQKMRHLHMLQLDATKITNKGLALVAKLKWLAFLTIADTKIDDAGISYLKKLSLLESLDVSGTGLTDKGLTHLRQIKQLRSLQIKRTRVTDKGVNALKKALPKLTVIR